ncbi:polymorphic toxin-type HINT domain-containing protein [Acanthopleuribacter pedis]|uniref:Hint domain-containing protein n=1 Tax=Acanthopleuribacter pedis TaxID=442870 RepID=A0A8J7U4G9_9BACT|nr:polymorphic toxin-type HINT domain-containing protein [Acanthopleuribacter pedis]MBO1318276.1 hypothetical protein [Acanthopleuribacter pedis]
MRVSLILAFLMALCLPAHASKKEPQLPHSSPSIAAFSVFDPAQRKAPDGVETNLDRPEFDRSRAFDGVTPNASIDLYSGALVIQAQDLVLPGAYGVDFEVNRDFNGKVYVPRADTQQVRAPDSWVGVGWSLNWGVLTISEPMVVFQLSGYPIQRMYLATDGTGTDPAGNQTHDYRFRSPISGNLVQPYMSKNFWRAWPEPNPAGTDPIWYVQDTAGKLFQVERVDHAIGTYATTRIWHPKSPDTDLRFQYEPAAIRITHVPARESRTQIMVSLENSALQSIRVGGRTLSYGVSRCGGNPKDPEQRNCLTHFTNGENERTEYQYGTRAGNRYAELDRITTPMGAVYTYEYDDETYYHFLSPTGQYNTRVVRSYQRGDQVWEYEYRHPQVDRFDEDHQFYVATDTHLLSTVTGPENTRRQYSFFTYSGAIHDDVTLTTWAHDAGRLDRFADYHQEYWNLERITGARYTLSAGLNENGLIPSLYFTHEANPEDGKRPHMFLSGRTESGFHPDEQLPGQNSEAGNPFVLQHTIAQFEERGETELPHGGSLSWVVDPYARPKEIIAAHYNAKAPDRKHVTRRERIYTLSDTQKTHNQVFLIEQEHLFHNGPSTGESTVILPKAPEANTPATVLTRQYNDYGDQTRSNTRDVVTEQEHTVFIEPAYVDSRVVVREPYRDDIRITSQAGLPRQVEVFQNGLWITLRSAEYDIFGNMVSYTNSLNQVFSFEYDHADRVRFERSPLMQPTQTQYTLHNGGLVRWQIGTDGPWEEISFDVYGRKVDHRRSEIPQAQFVYRYDALDRLVELTHPNGGRESWQYDAIGRVTVLTRERDDREEVQHWQFLSGIGVLHTDGQGNATFTQDDGGGYPSSFVDQTGATTDIETDAFGRVIRVSHGTATRTRTYSGLGRLLEEFHPETGLRKFEYNSIGDLVAARFFADLTTPTPHKVQRFEYDQRGRITYQHPDSLAPTEPFIRFEYNTENLVSMHSNLADLVFDYDGANRLEARHFSVRQSPQVLTTRYGYSEEGSLEWTLYPSGSRLTHSFDQNRHLNGVSVATEFGTSTLVEDMSYAPGLGQYPNPVPASWSLGNDTQEVRFFGPYGRPYAEEVRRLDLGGQRLLRKERTFDVLGRVTRQDSFSGNEMQPGQVVQYRYDPLSRLLRADYWDHNADTHRFDDFFYDQDNNLLAYGGNGEDPPMQYPVSADLNEDGEISVRDLHGFQFGDARDQDVAFARDLDGDGQVTILDAAKQGTNVAPFVTPEDPIPNRLVGWTFSPEGNVTRTPDGNRYTYNAWDQLIGFGDTHHIGYGPEGQRILEWRDGDSEKKFTLFNEAGDPIAEYRLTGNTLTLLKETYYFGGKPVATEIYEPEGGQCSERVWFHSDYLGSPTDYTDDSGVITGSQRFAAFGQKWSQDMACVPTSRGFTGHQDLDHRDLTWMKARSYSNRYGRFLQPDPLTITPERLVNPGQLNLYTYVNNSPTLAVDPEGEWAWHVAGAVIGAGADLTAQLIVNGGDLEKVSWKSVAMGGVSGAMGGGALKAAGKLTGSALKAGFERFAIQTGHDVIEHALNGSGSAAGSAAPCFPAGTLILSRQGHVPIESIAVGDWVWSRHDQTGEESWQQVDRLFLKEADGVHALRFLGSDGIVIHLDATAEHPFWGESEAWVSADQLTPGDRIWSRSGWITVQENRYVPGHLPVYNFEVRDTHTYFVGQDGVWAHNSCAKVKASPKGGTYTLRDPRTGEVRRTGQTNNLKRREKEHGRGNETKDLVFKVDKTSDDKAARRGREQIIYDKHPEADLNKRRPISPKNPRKKEYMEKGQEL